jgi:hypothetical protein
MMEGPALKLERAKEHLHRLEVEVSVFLAQEPYAVVAEEEPASGDRVWRVRVKEQPPQKWGVVIGEVVHALRSALDLMVCTLVERNGHHVTDQTGFPIVPSKHDLKAALPKIRGVSGPAADMILGFRPYKGGDDQLWMLHRLDIADKHRLLIAVGAAYRNIVISFPVSKADWIPSDFKSPEIALRPADRAFPLQDGIEVFRVMRQAREAGELPEPKFTFEIAFGGRELPSGEPLSPTLHQLTGHVEEILSAVSALP